MGQLILNVDDFEPQRYARTRVLQAAGFEVIEAGTGAEALALAHERRPALVVLDVHLPDIDGREVCRLIKMTPATASTLVLHISAELRDADIRTAALNNGADGYLAERVEPGELVAQVRALLRLSAAEAETHEARAALSRNEAKYRALFEHMTEGFYLAEVICDEAGGPVDFRFLDANAAFEPLTGLDRGATIGRTVREVLPGAEAHWIQAYGRVALTGEPAKVESFTATLGRYYESVAYSPRKGQFACLFHDVTERKRSEEALRQSEADLRAMFEVPSVGKAQADIATRRFLRVNAAFCRLTGYSEAELLQMSAEDVNHPDDREQDRELFSRMVAGELPVYQIEKRYVRKDGALVWVEVTGNVIRDAAGRPVRSVAVIQDISERKRVERALHESAERLRAQAEDLRTILDTLPAAVFITHDPEGRAMEGNRFTEEMLRLPRRSNVSKSAPQAQRPTTFKAMQDERELQPDELPVQIAARTGREVRDFQFDLVYDDGSRVAMLGNAAPFVDEAGHARGAVGAFIDVTARRRAEEALSQANADLAEADRQKDEFLAILSHELRNPLAPIRYALPLLQAQPLNDTGTRAVAVLGRQVSHLTRLVDDLLDVSRITSGKIELRREHVTLASVVASAAESAAPALAAGRHTLELAVSDEPVWVYGDPARLAQVVTNLLDNSAKYTPEGGKVVVAAGAENGEAVVRVRDNGVGIPARSLPRVFEMFRQVHRSTGTAGGLGIGLALVRRLVQMHGGAVQAHSDGEGQGAEFVVRLPLAREAGPAQTAAGAERAGGKRLRVLVVDDNADFADMLGLVVEQAGHDVRKALDGRSAVSAALSYRPHVVLLDLGLPGMSGIDVARELRRHPELGGPCLVAVTGWGQTENRRQTREAGFDHHLTKPTEPAALQQLLAGLADRA